MYARQNVNFSLPYMGRNLSDSSEGEIRRRRRRREYFNSQGSSLPVDRREKEKTKKGENKEQKLLSGHPGGRSGASKESASRIWAP